jgi:hypothetical protein
MTVKKAVIRTGNSGEKKRTIRLPMPRLLSRTGQALLSGEKNEAEKQQHQSYVDIKE